MLKEYQISNFKAFDGPETLPIKPITLIFGPNSSGKSSILQSLLMLKQTLADRENAPAPLLFKGDLVDLGSYRELVHRHEAERSFSVKVTMRMPKGLDEPFEYPWIVGAWGETEDENLSDIEEVLEGFQTVAIGISFSYTQDKPGTDVSRIELFLGENPLPLIIFERQKLLSGDDDRKCLLNFKSLNKDHEYWHKHWKKFDETNDSHVRAILENADGGDHIREVLKSFEKMTPEEQAEFQEELLRRLRILKAEGKDTKPEPPTQSTPRFSQDEKERLLKLGGFELALKAYRILHEDDVLGLRGFLPETLNNDVMSDILTSPAEHSRNISVLALTVGGLFRHVLEKTLYIGPLRNFPERYFMFSGVSAAYVGKSGKFVPDILVADKELLAKVNERLDSFDLGYELKLTSLSDQTTAVQDLFALRLYDKSTGIHVGTTDVGFGFSQVLPVIAQCLLSKQNMILIEQPELHLHPRLQAELGDLFIDSALGSSKNTLVIETHSEHLILRLLRRIRETAEGNLDEGQIPITPDDLAVVYAKPTEHGTRLVHLGVTDDGDFADSWPDGFFAERARELF